MRGLPKKDESGICPHCYHAVRFVSGIEASWDRDSFTASTDEGEIDIWKCRCPNCEEVIICASSPFWTGTIYPMGSSRPPIPLEVTDESIKKDYREACFIINFSANAAGALARRCLSQILVKHFGAREKDRLPKQIEKAKEEIKDDQLVEDLDYVREVGRFAAHAKEDLRTGEIIDVTYEEVEATLTIIEELFDEVYVKPAKRKERWAKMKEKKEATKKPSEETPEQA